MPLKLEVESLDGIPEEVHGLYVEKEGRYALDVEGLPDTNGLKTALEKERKAAKDLKTTLGQFKDVDLEKYNDLLAREAELNKHNPEAIEKMVNERVKKNDEKWKAQFEDLQSTLASKDSKLGDLMITNELRAIGGELGVRDEEAMTDFIARGKAIFKLKDDQVVPMKGDDIVYGESGVEPLTMREFGKKLAETATHLFKPSGGGGASNTGGGNAGSGTVRYKSDLQTAAEKAKYIGKHGRRAYLELPEREAS